MRAHVATKAPVSAGPIADHEDSEPNMAHVTFASADIFLASAQNAETVMVVAPAAALKEGSAWAVLAAGAPALAPVLASPATAAMADDARASVDGSSIATYVGGPGKLRQLVFVPLPDSASRLYSETHSMAMSGGLVDAGLADATNACDVFSQLYRTRRSNSCARILP